MKTNKLLLAIVCIITLQFTACKKEEEPTLTGTWLLQKLYDSAGNEVSLKNGNTILFEEEATFYPCNSTTCNGSIKTTRNYAPYYDTYYTDVTYIAGDKTTLSVNNVGYIIETFTLSELVIYQSNSPKAKRMYKKL